MPPPCDVGLIGLGVMGRALAANMAERGFSVAGLDSSADALAKAAGADATIVPAATLEELLGQLRAPRLVVLLLPAGTAVDERLAALRSALSPGDVVADAGNSHFRDTQRRAERLRGSGIELLGVGISGGEQGARHGPSIMVGGTADGWRRAQPLLTAVAAEVDGYRCAARVGADGAGHFVKMVHNGIEYADMQLIGEVVSLLRQVQGLSEEAIAALLEGWRATELESYLLDVTVDLLRMRDVHTGGPVLEIIEDVAGHKGTGVWAAVAALELGVSAPCLLEAVAARALSVRRAARQRLSGSGWRGLGAGAKAGGAAAADLQKALLAGRLAAFAQGFELLRAGSEAHGWDVDLATVARLWRAGCIIRARVLDVIAAGCAAGLDERGLLGSEPFAAALTDAVPGLRRAVGEAATAAVPTPCLASALAWLDGMHAGRLPANLLQAQRDAFGAHGFTRIDRPGRFHLDGRQD